MEAVAQEVAQVESPETVLANANASEQPIQAEPKESTFSLDDVDDEALLKHITKKYGAKFKSVEDLKPAPPKPTKEQLDQEEEEETKQAYAWGIATGRIKKDKYEESIKEKQKSAREISLSKFAEQMKEIDPKFSDSDIEEMYKDAYYEEEEDDSPRRKLALKRIEREYVDHLSSYKDLENESVLSDYRAVRSNEQKLKGYKSSVRKELAELPKEFSHTITYKDEKGVEQTETYTVPFDESSSKELEKEWANEGMYQLLGLGEKDADIPEGFLNRELTYHQRARSMDRIISEIAEKHANKKVEALEARMKGVVPNTDAVTIPTPQGKLIAANLRFGNRTPNPETQNQKVLSDSIERARQLQRV